MADRPSEERQALRLALEECADFACFNEDHVGDPCACCDHVREIALAALDRDLPRMNPTHAAAALLQMAGPLVPMPKAEPCN